MTNKEKKLFNAWLDIPGAAPAELQAYHAARARNEAQRARRASPAIKAREAAHSRASYWRRRYLTAPVGSPEEAKAWKNYFSARVTLRELRQ
jgi:hypothetical protein